MISRRILSAELPALLRLYTFLHVEDATLSAEDPAVRSRRSKTLTNENLHIHVIEGEKKIVSTCVLTLIPNLTRGLRPYDLIENVVTDPSFCWKGCKTEVLRYALENARRAGCYKVMLETGSQQAETLRFCEQAGFQREVKTGFIADPEQKAS